MKTRSAEINDAIAIADIYNYYILNTTASFYVEKLDASHYARDIESNLKSALPYLVLQDDSEQIIGFAYARPWKTRDAYRHTAEITVCLHHEMRKRGYGRVLHDALVEACKETKYLRTLIAVVGDLSVSDFYPKLGWRSVGTLRGVGYKFDKWQDTALFQLDL